VPRVRQEKGNDMVKNVNRTDSNAEPSREESQQDWDAVLNSELDSPYCECNEQPYEEEQASGVCSACGKPL
jgi:hypothetical protein